MKPLTRKEIYLASMAGEYTGELPEPLTREETYLRRLAEELGALQKTTENARKTLDGLTNYDMQVYRSDPAAEQSGAPLTFDDAVLTVTTWTGWGLCCLELSGRLTYSLSGNTDPVSLPLPGIALPPAAYDSYFTVSDGVELGVTQTGGDLVIRNRGKESASQTGMPFACSFLYPIAEGGKSDV